MNCELLRQKKKLNSKNDFKNQTTSSMSTQIK